MGMSKVRNHVMIFLLVVFGLVAVASGLAYGYLNNYDSDSSNHIIDGVQVGSVYVGGVEREEALSKVASLSKRTLSQMVVLNYGDKTWKVNLADLGIELDLEGIIDEAVGVGHKGNLWNRYRESYLVKKEGRKFDLFYKIEEARTASIIAELTKELNTEPQDAEFIVNSNNELTIISDKPGFCIDSEAAVQELKSILTGGVNEPLDKTWHVTLNMAEVYPQVTGKDLNNRRINGLLSTYTTQFNASNVNRTYNVKVAAEALNHQQIKPGETFSFNQVVGPRSQEAGYKEALIILKNEFVPGLGGGVCQVSSTLYNSVLLADLTVVERSNHSLPVDYVPPGLDATVAYGVLDFKFVNSTEGHLILQTSVKGNRLTIQIFGDKKFRKEIEVSNRVIAKTEPGLVQKPNPDLYEGQEFIEQIGKPGLRVQTYRIIKEQGNVGHEELLATSVYSPLKQIVQVGTKKNTEPPDQPVPESEEAKTPGSIPVEVPPGENTVTPPETNPVEVPTTGPEANVDTNPQTSSGNGLSVNPSMNPEVIKEI
jgi:vancomycin resistance protein YoaR